MSTLSKNNHVEMLEKGDIFLLDWPEAKNYTRAEKLVEKPVEKVESQRFYLLMHPCDWCNHRLIHICKRSRGQDGAHYSGVVDEIVRSDRTLHDHFAAAAKEGIKRFDHPPLTFMRLVGMGEYQLVRAGNHTELAYELVPPHECSEEEPTLTIGSSSTYIIGIKNPQSVETTQALQECYNAHGFLNADPANLLDQEGLELLLFRTGNIGPENIGPVNAGTGNRIKR